MMGHASFGDLLRAHRAAARLSQTALARQTGCDPAYVNRLERAGDRRRDGSLIALSLPRRTIVCAMAQALRLDALETDRLLYAAGLAPATDWQTRALSAEARLDEIRRSLWPEEEPARIRSFTG